MTRDQFKECMEFLNGRQLNPNCYIIHASSDKDSCRLTAIFKAQAVNIVAYSKAPINHSDIHTTSELVRIVENTLLPYGYSIFGNECIISTKDRASIFAAINTKNLAQNIVRVKSSNVWGYAMNIKSNRDKTGDLIVQFKDKNGGAGDVYIYYDVPVTTYRRWQSAPSKGHFFWLNIRNVFKYSRLTGNKRGVLPNAINQ